MKGLCPLNNFKECIGFKCAWYNTMAGMCSVYRAGL